MRTHFTSVYGLLSFAGILFKSFGGHKPSIYYYCLCGCCCLRGAAHLVIRIKVLRTWILMHGYFPFGSSVAVKDRDGDGHNRIINGTEVHASVKFDVRSFAEQSPQTDGSVLLQCSPQYVGLKHFGRSVIPFKGNIRTSAITQRFN